MKFRLLVSALALSLAACGGGGGDAPAASLQLSDLQGFWSGPLTGTDLHGATHADSVVLNDGTAWTVLRTDTATTTTLVGLVKGQLSVSGTTYSGSGKDYTFSPAAVRDVSLSGTASAGTSLSTSVQVSGATTTTASTMTYNSRYRTAAVQGDFAGAWQGSVGGGAVVVTWTVATNGALSGTDTTGCTYAGTVLTRPEGVAVYNLNVTETCAGASNTWSGIATLDTDKTKASFAFVTADGSAANLLIATKN